MPGPYPALFGGQQDPFWLGDTATPIALLSLMYLLEFGEKSKLIKRISRLDGQGHVVRTLFQGRFKIRCGDTPGFNEEDVFMT